jgi:UDP-N-acetylmuramoyl-tripeptide--D-alanyl-D-alanine ligase
MNIDDPLIASRLDEVHCCVRTFGVHSNADYRAANLSASWPDRLSFDLHCGRGDLHVQTALLGRHNLTCVLAAIAVADALGADLEQFTGKLRELPGPPGRMQERCLKDGRRIVLDHVKAGAYGVEDCLSFAADARARRTYLVLGQMSDTFAKEGRLVRRFARSCRERGINLVVLGPMRRKMIRREAYGFADGIGVFESVIQLAEYFARELSEQDLVVVKSNKTSNMERLILADSEDVQCGALSCGRREGCMSCPELTKPHPPEYKFDESQGPGRIRNESAGA